MIDVVSILRQRNSSLIFGLGMMLANIILSICLVIKSQKIVVDVPPSLKSSFWLEGNISSASYLKEMGLFIAHLMLDKNILSQRFNHEVILSYVAPDSHKYMIGKLMADEDRYTSEGLNTIFYPQSSSVDITNNEVTFTGELTSSISTKEVSKEKITLKVKFKYVQGRWKLAKFEGVKDV